MALNYSTTQDPRKVAEQQRGLIQQQGDQLMQQNSGLAQAGADKAAGYEGFLNPITQTMAQGQGGYTPEEIAAIQGQTGPYGLNTLPTSQEQLQGNFLTPEEETAMKGDPASYTRYFNPDLMDQNLRVAQGKQGQAVNDLQQNLKGAIDPAALSQSGAYQQDSANQLDQNQGQFKTVLGAEGQNVRGFIDPGKLTQSSEAAANEVMTPEQEQQMVTGAGISAGVRNQAAVGALQRQALAAGTSPLGVAAYRARMNKESAAQAGDAMTQARIAAQRARAEESLQSEQQRLGAQSNLTNIGTGTELAMGQQAVAGTQALGEQALKERQAVEAQRLGAEQYKTGAQIQTATTGGEAALQNAQTATGQGQQQAQYATNTGTNIAEAQDAAAADRAKAIAANRQATGQSNQATAFGQGSAVNQAGSARAQQIGNTRISQQNVGLGLQTGQETQANANAQGALGREQQTYATQTGGTNQAAALQLGAAGVPTTTDKLVGAIAGGVGAAAGAAGGLDEGGIVSEPSLHVVGEHGPEMIMPVGGHYRARMAQKRPVMAHRKGRRTYGEVA